MTKTIDIDERRLSLQQTVHLLSGSSQVLLRKNGHVIARLEPADDIDAGDEAWAHAPAQVRRGLKARMRCRQHDGIPHAEVKKELGL